MLAGIPRFTLQLGQTRLFANRIKPRVIAVMALPNPHLKQLADTAESCAPSRPDSHPQNGRSRRTSALAAAALRFPGE